jgi:zinc/manganese transport system substrate-binding protein
MKSILVGVLLVRLLACFSSAEEKVKVVSFSTVLTEIAERVGGKQVQVVGLVKPGVDPHEYEPTPADLKLVEGANVILLSAKHMEGYVGKLKEATGTKGLLLQVGDNFPSLKVRSDGGHHHHHGENKGGQKEQVVEDPHWWHSIDHVKRAVKVVQGALTKLLPADSAVIAANAEKYTQELDGLDKWARSEVAKLPRNQRKLVTSHDAFQYFAKSYGFAIHSIEGVSSEDQPSSKDVAELIAVIKDERVKAIFLESIINPKVSQEITKETGAKIGGVLYADGLGEGDASTYAGMFRHNVQTIVSALR